MARTTADAAQPHAPPAVSVAMSVYNGARFLDAAIASVRAQTFRDFEFLILDDGSADRSAHIARRHAAEDARIRVIARENRGLIASLNQLLAEARAPLIARMDADDVCQPERFARQVAFLAAHPDHGVVGSWTDDIDEFGRRCRSPAHDQPVTHAEMLRAIEHITPICHPSVMARREVLLAVGGYHRAYRHCEDYDLWLRLANITKLANIPERLLRYRRYDEQISSRHAYAQQLGAAIAQHAYRERMAGRPDPTAELDELPAVDALDALFGRPGVSQAVRAKVGRGLMWSPAAMGAQGFDLLLDHIRLDHARGPDIWRTVGRLMTFRMPARAARLAWALASGR